MLIVCARFWTLRNARWAVPAKPWQNCAKRQSHAPDTLIRALSERADVRNLTAVSNNAGSGQLGLGTCRTSNTASHSWNTVCRKITPYRADRQDDIFIYWGVGTTSLPSLVELLIALPFLGISTLSSFISRARYLWNSYHRVPSPNACAHTPQGYPRFSLPLVLLLRWRRVRYLSGTTRAVYPKGSRFPGSVRSIVSSMGEDTCSNMPSREMLRL